MARLLTRAQYARRGWRDPQTGQKTKYTRQRITQLVKQGVITLKGDKIDPAQADAAIAANVDHSRHIKEEKKKVAAKTPQMEFSGNGFNNDRKNAIPQNSFNTQSSNEKGYEGKSLTETRRDLTVLKINHEDLKRQLTEIDLRIKLGELIDRSEVLGLFTYRIQIVKQGLLSFHRSLPPLLAGKDAREISDILRRKVLDLLDRFSEKTGILKGTRHAKKRTLARRDRSLETSTNAVGQ